jgi:ubiquinone/menaquinone biosynthesis C-methylase UbiE
MIPASTVGSGRGTKPVEQGADASVNEAVFEIHKPPITAALVASGFDRIAPRYDSVFRSRRCCAEDRLLAASLRPFLRGSSSMGDLLDVGCGTGALLRLVKWPVWHYTGIDVSAGMLAEAGRQYPNATFYQASVEAMPFPDGQFERVVSIFSALSYVPGPARAVREIFRVLRPGGRCFVMVYAPRWYRRNADCAGDLHLHLAPAAWSAWQAVTRFHLAGFYPELIRLSAFSILPTPLLRFDALLARRFPEAGRYLIIEAARPA